MDNKLEEPLIEFPDNKIANHNQEKETKKMSIFGDMDVAEISDNPFAVDSGTYMAEVRDANFRDNSKKGGFQALAIDWYIDEPENEFHNSKVSDFLAFPDPSQDVDAAGKRQQKFMKRRLRRAFDMTDAQMQKFEDPKDLIGKKAYIDVKFNDPFVNVMDAKSERLYREENGESAGSVDSDLNLEL